jgi:hypothetical protein
MIAQVGIWLVRVNTQTRIGFTEEAIALRNALKCFHEFIQQRHSGEFGSFGFAPSS